MCKTNLKGVRTVTVPREPTPEQLSLINYQNQLQRDSNRVAMRQYNNTLYKATLRFINSEKTELDRMRYISNKGD